MQMNSILDLTATLDGTLIRADGSHREISNLSTSKLDLADANWRLGNAYSWWKKLFKDEHGLVTTTGINYLAADFLSASSARINAFTYHDSGTGVTAAVIGDTTLQSAAGPARVSGVGTNPVSGTYKSVATIAYTGTLAISEWGLFSASTSGTMWDHRIFSSIGVNSGDSITWNYSVVAVAGGS